MKKIWSFCKDIYDPGIHIYFSLNWYLALYAAFAINHKKEWLLNSSPIKVILSLFLILFFLRIVDEIKDFEYDKIFNPDRPLVKGTVSLSDLNIYMIVIVVLTLALNYQYGWSVIYFLLFEFFYGYFLIYIEKLSKTARDHILLNLIITYPVNVLLSIYIFFVFKAEQSNIHWNQYDTMILISFACNFLYYEFTRKICWPDLAGKGQRFYSEHLGFYNSIFWTMSFSFFAMFFLIQAFDTWAPLVLLIPLGFGLSKLIRDRQKKDRSSLPLQLSGSLFIGLFYAVLITLGILDFYMGFDFNTPIGP
ncbi:MAG: hypothetical protein KC493_09705 [Bacteriovoracaceae bacterium]|nr:hypothetical protein [Bacteriovoracaceae bacterium]